MSICNIDLTLGRFMLAVYNIRVVTTGATGATAVSPKFSDTLTLLLPIKGSRVCPPSQRSQLTFFCGYFPASIQNVLQIFMKMTCVLKKMVGRLQGESLTNLALPRQKIYDLISIHIYPVAIQISRYTYGVYQVRCLQKLFSHGLFNIQYFVRLHFAVLWKNWKV